MTNNNKPGKQHESFEYYSHSFLTCFGVTLTTFIVTLIFFGVFFSIFSIIPAIIFAEIALILTIIYYIFEPESRKEIKRKHFKNPVSVCPMCGNSDIGMRTKYLKTRCRCHNCGNIWSPPKHYF